MTTVEQIIEHFSPSAARKGLLSFTFKLKDLLRLGTTQDLPHGFSIVWPQALTWRISDAGNGYEVAFVSPDYPVAMVPVPLLGSKPFDVVGLTVRPDMSAWTVSFHFQSLPDITAVFSLDN